jgi:cytochrome b561
MALRDSHDNYGVITRVFHWVMAIAIFAVFGLGAWMVKLDYYSAYYTAAPDLHRSAGMVLLGLLVLRFFWRIINDNPGHEMLSRLERVAAELVHWGFYLLLLALLVSGYLMSTLDGRGVEVFGWLTVPSVYEHKGWESAVGKLHAYLAYATIVLAGLHTLAALKHHFVDGDAILTRMWSGRSTRTGQS